MSDGIKAFGSCLCGAVRIRAEFVSRHVGACHCGMCRKWGGGPFLSVDCGSEVEFEGAELIATFASSPWAERGFCKQCGTHLFYRFKDQGQHIMPVGVFGDIQDVVFEHQIFIDRKPPYYEFANQTRNLTEADVFAMYADNE